MQLLVHDMEMACTAAFNAMVKVRGEKVLKIVYIFIVPFPDSMAECGLGR
jgi:hypothetical protein